MIFELIFTTDGSGNAIVERAVGKSNLALLYAVIVSCSSLSGGTLTLKTINTLAGFDVTLLSLAAANVNATKYPRAKEHGTDGADATTTAVQVVNGSLQLTVSGGGANKTGKVVCYLL